MANCWTRYIFRAHLMLSQASHSLKTCKAFSLSMCTYNKNFKSHGVHVFHQHLEQSSLLTIGSKWKVVFLCTSWGSLPTPPCQNEPVELPSLPGMLVVVSGVPDDFNPAGHIRKHKKLIDSFPVWFGFFDLLQFFMGHFILYATRTHVEYKVHNKLIVKVHFQWDLDRRKILCRHWD